ncbi:MAG TPA: phosphoenolpyruvate--protein phosphotransferase [Actinotalea sp.]
MGDLARVGLVVVSHSSALAWAAVGLAQEMLHGAPVRIEVAAGLDEHTLGTDALAIHRALLDADTGAGVVVLMDLGSAILSTELALDLLDDEARAAVTLCAAPIVEGLVVAVVAAAGGASREVVAAEATAALAGKQAHLGGVGDSPDDASGASDGATAASDGATAASDGASAASDGASAEVVGRFVVANPHGLHARPAARLVQEAGAFDAVVTLRNLTTGAGPVPARSLSRVATLGAQKGHDIEVVATGPDARCALDHLLALADRAFDEDLAGHAPQGGGAPPLAGPVRASGPMPASPGIGIGLAWVAASAPVVAARTTTDDPAADRAGLAAAIGRVTEAIRAVRADTARDLGEQDAAIFDAHLQLLADDDLLGDADHRIGSGEGAPSAWAAAVARVEAAFAALSDPYLQARAADVRAVGDQVLADLLGVERSLSGATGVLVATDLTPADVAGLDPVRVAAVVLAHGSPTAHCAILARAKGIPVVVGAGAAVLDVAAGTLMAVDGTAGEVVVDPSAEEVAHFRTLADAFDAARTRALQRADRPALTSDGTTVLVGANLGSLADAVTAASSGADLAGLVRTEFLFLGRQHAPDVDEQEASYLALAEAIGGRRLTLRTLDVGGDKPLGYVPMPVEANPFLGLRGLRLSLARPGLLADQLLAVVRTAHRTPVSVMFPMVSVVPELLEARRLLGEAIERDGRGRPSGLEVGIMVEVPAAALKAAAFAPFVDFFSIGTNDLTQYTMAAERGSGDVAVLGDPYDPGVLRLIGCVGDAAGAAMVGVCGELAADPAAVPLLIGLGVHELSMSPLAIPQVKDAVRGVDRVAARDLARRALTLDGPLAVRALLAEGR